MSFRIVCSSKKIDFSIQFFGISDLSENELETQYMCTSKLNPRLSTLYPRIVQSLSTNCKSNYQVHLSPLLQFPRILLREVKQYFLSPFRGGSKLVGILREFSSPLEPFHKMDFLRLLLFCFSTKIPKISRVFAWALEY